MIKLSDDFYEHVANYRKWIEINHDEKRQLDILQEECAEVIQAVSKLKRGKQYARDRVIEEITHALISIFISMDLLGFRDKDISYYVRLKDDLIKKLIEE